MCWTTFYFQRIHNTTWRPRGSSHSLPFHVSILCNCRGRLQGCISTRKVLTVRNCLLPSFKNIKWQLSDEIPKSSILTFDDNWKIYLLKFCCSPLSVVSNTLILSGIFQSLCAALNLCYFKGKFDPHNFSCLV